MPDVAVEIVGSNQIPAGASEGSSDINFGALREQASKLLGDDTPDDAPVIVPAKAEEPDPTQVRVKAAAPVVADKAKEVAAPSGAEVVVTQKLPADLTDDTPVRVTVDGEEQILPWGEAKGKISGGLKFTKSMQDLAKQRSEWAAEAAQLATLRTERDNLNRFLNNEEAVTGFVKQKFPHLFQQPAAAGNQSDYNPDEIATVGQARTIAEQQLAAVGQQITEVKKFVQDSIATANQEIADRTETAKHAAVLHNTLADIFTKNPVLNAVPNAEHLIRFEVSKMLPQTQEEAVAAFNQVAAGMVEEIGKHFKATQKIEAVAAAKQKLVNSSIEPAGGSNVQIKPTSFKNSDGQVDWKKVAQQAREAL